MIPRILPTVLSSEERDAFRAYLAEAERRRAVIALAFAPILFVLFGWLDWVAFPRQVSTLWAIRAAASGLMAVVFLLTLRVNDYWPLVVHTASSFWIGAVALAWMCHVTGGHESPYYAGINLALVFVAVLLTWPRWFAALVFGVVLTVYYVPMFFEPELNPRLLLMHSFFVLSGVAIALVGIQVRTRLAMQEFLGRRRLALINNELHHTQRSKDQMFQNVSHELRTPLTLMLSPLESVLDDPALPAKFRPALLTFERNGRRLLKQINDMLDLAKLERVGLPVVTTAIDVGELVRRLADDVKGMAVGQRIELSLELPERPVIYDLDRAHTERILLNLLANAVKFTPAGGSVTIRLGDDETGLQVSVEDDGEGIPRNDQAAVFERFRQADGGSTRRHGGSGIGLSLVVELAKLMDGSVTLASAPGDGSCFTLRIPRHRRSTATEVPSESPSLDGSELWRRRDEAWLHLGAAELDLDGDEVLQAGTRGARVLLAEDDPELRAHLVELLADRYRVMAVGDGATALERAATFSPHVIVTDVMMPGVDGVQLVSGVREQIGLRETAIVMLTARGELEDRVRGRTVGADSYLTKPFHARELLASLEGLLRARRRLVGSFLVDRPIGRGGQGQVYLAEHAETGERAAVKLITSVGADDEASRRRLRREQRALVTIRHPNVVRVFEEGVAEPGFYIAMEYLSGVTFKELVSRHGKLSPGQAAALGEGMVAALAAVHRAGLVHRDIKCSNLMLLEGRASLSDRVRLIDFGTVNLGRSSLTEPGRLIGTPAYLAPELIRGAAPSVASDIYAAGVSIFFLVTGSLPFDRSDPSAVLHDILSFPTPRASHRRPGIPEVLDEAIFRAMARDPARRFPDASEVSAALEAVPRSADELELEVRLEDHPSATPNSAGSPECSFTPTVEPLGSI